MRYVALHCHNPACGHRMWIPIPKLGSQVRCSECRQLYQTPRQVPDDNVFEGPDIIQDFNPGAMAEAGVRS